MPTTKIPVTKRQLYRDLSPDMKSRDRRLRVTAFDETHATLVIEHDLAGLIGKTTRVSVTRLQSPAFELLEDLADADPLYTALLAAIANEHRTGATPADYARAALQAVRAVNSDELTEAVTHEIVREIREETLRMASGYLRKKYGVTNRSAGALMRLAELETQGRSALKPL